MPIRLINTTKFLEALISVNKDRFAFAQYALEHHPKIAIAYDEWLAGETVRKEEEQRENERKRQEAIENEKRRLEMEKKWAIRVVDVNNKVNASGKKIPIIKFLREGCLGYYGLADAKQWSEGSLDVYATKEMADTFEIKFYNEFPMLRGILNIWVAKH